MKMCRLFNESIVPEPIVNETIDKLKNLINTLRTIPSLEFSKKLVLAELDYLAKYHRYDILNIDVKNILIGFGLLSSKGVMSEDVRNVIRSGLDMKLTKRGFMIQLWKF